MDRITETFLSEKPDQGDKTILIVEDEVIMLRLLEKFFSRHGYNVLVATDGEQAVDVYRSHMRQIDVVLLDMRLPKIMGGEVFRLLKNENPAVKVVMASGFLEPEVKIEMAVAGAKRFVNKPYNLVELLEIFQSVIDDE
jgi:two-component system, cell cycle sensor histidine kinase and response regulator CckA